MNNLINKLVATLAPHYPKDISHPVLTFGGIGAIIAFAVINALITNVPLVLIVSIIAAAFLFVVPVYEYRNGAGSAYRDIGKPTMAKVIMYAYLVLGALHFVTGLLALVAMPLAALTFFIIGTAIFVHGWVMLDSIEANKTIES